MANFANHDEYIEAAPQRFNEPLVRLRALLAEVLPDAEELIMYDIPGFGFGKNVIAGYAAFSKQCGLYVSNGAIEAHANDIRNAGLKATKTGIKFSPKKPIPDDLIAKLVLASRKELGV